MADLIRPRCRGDKALGILLPPSVGGVLVNVAAGLLGKVAVNLNYTASPEAMASAVRQAELRCTVSSRLFLDKLKEKLGAFEPPPGTLYLEDLLPEVGKAAKVWALARARLWPRRLLVHAGRFSGDDIATILFSSGSTGDPKGVMLSHHNIQSNVEAANKLLRVTPDDVFCGILPFFHAFGYTALLWFPLLHGVGAAYHPNPLDGAKVAEMVRERKCTILVGTPAFLLTYLRRAKPEDFRSLRFCIAGAEKLKSKLAEAFAKRFGITPMEGYGATELAPIASINLPDVVVERSFQVGTKPGSAGHPLPGVAMRVVDPATGALLGEEQEGLLLVRGPNVMQGYLGRPEATAEVIQDGWYNTGDIARIDDDGFVTITDRLSRFSKIGGEMVPHGAAEDVLLDAVPSGERAVAVTSIPDERRGERLVVAYTGEAGEPGQLQAAVAASSLPNLWKPRPDDYVPVAEIPMLGSGKLDLRRLKELAQGGIDEARNTHVSGRSTKTEA